VSSASIWVLADPRPGTAAQALGIAERLGVPFEVKRVEFSRWAAMPNRLLGASLAGLSGAEWRPPWPRLVIAAGRRTAPAALWLARQGARTVQVMGPGFPASRFDLVVRPAHDRASEAPNLLRVLGAPHRITLERLAAAAGRFRDLPSPRVALLVGGPVRGVGLDAAAAGALARQVAAAAGSVLASTSRRTGQAAAEAVAAALAGHPHRLHRFGQAGDNPYLSLLADADAVVVTGDSTSMISEAAITPAALYVADLPGASGPRHRAFHQSLYDAGQARPFEARLDAFARTSLDETARIAEAIRARGLLPGGS
jgi:mitochondrial fission protein ELM1